MYVCLGSLPLGNVSHAEFNKRFKLLVAWAQAKYPTDDKWTNERINEKKKRNNNRDEFASLFALSRYSTHAQQNRTYDYGSQLLKRVPSCKASNCRRVTHLLCCKNTKKCDRRQYILKRRLAVGYAHGNNCLAYHSKLKYNNAKVYSSPGPLFHWMIFFFTFRSSTICRAVCLCSTRTYNDVWCCWWWWHNSGIIFAETYFSFVQLNKFFVLLFGVYASASVLAESCTRTGITLIGYVHEFEGNVYRNARVFPLALCDSCVTVRIDAIFDGCVH